MPATGLLLLRRDPPLARRPVVYFFSAAYTVPLRQVEASAAVAATIWPVPHLGPEVIDDPAASAANNEARLASRTGWPHAYLSAPALGNFRREPKDHLRVESTQPQL